MFWDCLLDALIDTLKVLPILYLVYVLVSYLGHNNNNKYAKIMNKTKKFGPLVGGVAGIVPQCGFSVVMADLYSKKAITIGTLIAVMVATSDEAIPIMISEPEFILPMLALIGIKLVFAVLFGYVFDLVMKMLGKKQKVDATVLEEMHGHDCDLTSCEHIHAESKSDKHSHEHEKEHHEHEHEHKHNEKSCNDCCAHNIFLDALKHTAKISAFLFVTTLLINLVVNWIGMDKLPLIFGGNKFAQIFISGVVGLIPSCASSVFLVEFYMAGGLTFGALLAGLCSGSGIAIFVLFARNRKNILNNLLILLSVYAIGIAAGLIFTYIPMPF